MKESQFSIKMLLTKGEKSKLKGQNEQMSIQDNTKQKNTTQLPQTAR